ncbi:hypothetical protein [Blastococcus brunescens]|uniref:hypothetical protein n=1 Tax=Blastococcus brunescens TaxID=1564165 RepID=UPI003BEEE185
MLASGVLLGGGAAAAGAVLGVGLAWLAVPVIDAWWGVRFGPFDVPLLDVLVVVVIGVLAGLAASAVPARQAARTDVVPTLSGRRGRCAPPGGCRSVGSPPPSRGWSSSPWERPAASSAWPSGPSCSCSASCWRRRGWSDCWPRWPAGYRRRCGSPSGTPPGTGPAPPRPSRP